MPTIHVAKKFVFTDQDHQQYVFDLGPHEVPNHIAGHSFVKAHLVGAKDEAPQFPGGPKHWNSAPYVPNSTKEPVTPVQDPGFATANPQTPPSSPVGASGGPVAPDTKDDRSLNIKEQERFAGKESKNAKEADEALQKAKEEAEKQKGK